MTMATEELSAQQRAVLKQLVPLISEYLTETKLPTTLEAYLKELSFLQILIDEKLIGFWGIRLRSSGTMKLLTIKAFYVRRQYRGSFLNRAADYIFTFAENHGVTDVEIWNYPSVQRWFERRYKMKPKIFVTFNSFNEFRLPNQRS
jgi:hypothetical protein